MKIGEKIKKLRLEKSMTQSELAGSFITRNMLSLIESGSAQPSLPTVEYLAKRLNVPLGILVSDDNGEYFYRRMNTMENIHKTFKDKNYRICLSLCENLFDSVTDNELTLISAECCLGIAKEEFCDGHLKSAYEMFDHAVEISRSTIYNTLHIEAEATVYCNYMRELSPALYGENIDDTSNIEGAAFGDEFCKYVSIVKNLDSTDISMINRGIYKSLIDIKLKMQSKQNNDAMHSILNLLNGSEDIPVPLMYDLFCDLEICCKELGDFKGAYEYSGTKVVMLEKLLSEEI